MSRPPTTGERRPGHGLDEGARKALIGAIVDIGTTTDQILSRFLRGEAFADVADYLQAVTDVEGTGARRAFDNILVRLVKERMAGRSSATAQRRITQEARPLSVLLGMPEGDFLTALELGSAAGSNAFGTAALPAALNRISDKRGIPYRVSGIGRTMKFEWVGEPVVQEQAISPALGLLDDPRLTGGPRTEFRQARKELRESSPQARKQAVAEACNAVESTMKVLLDERGYARPSSETAQKLFNALVAANVLTRETEPLVLGASRFGNSRGRHGAGPVQHDVRQAEAEAVVAGAAVAIVLLASELPA